MKQRGSAKKKFLQINLKYDDFFWKSSIFY